MHAAPTELGGQYGTRGYKHGAPNGAFRISAPFHRARDACKEQSSTRAFQDRTGREPPFQHVALRQDMFSRIKHVRVERADFLARVFR